MKTAKPLSSDLSSSRRAQPIRQTRTNPPRSSGTLVRSFGARDSLSGGLGNRQSQEQQTDIFPAITYFTDVITALPKELVRHFTLLKEVDAKIFTPEEALGQLVDAALNVPLPPRRNQQEHPRITEPISAQVRAPVVTNGSIINSQVVTAADAPDPYHPVDSTWNLADVPRRQLFRQCTYTMQEMLISLDEKNHVLSTAAEALNKQLSRLDNCFPYIEEEIGEETRYGNEKHWAYTETRTSKLADRPRRDAGSANQIGNSHQVSVDEAAARSELRKQALLAKKGRTHQVESDFDDHIDGRHKGDTGKKPHGNSKKGRPTESTVTIGLGITNGAVANGNPPSKRRKVEKGPAGGTVMERSLSTVFGNNGVAPKGKTSSPGDTPAPDASKKKSKGASTTNGHTRKRLVLLSGIRELC
jgi:Inhibitor of growth proteins N-terminal histone-binding